MRARADARDAWVLLRTELRVRVRHVLGSLRRTLNVGLLALLFGLVFPLMGVGPALAFGESLVGPSVPLGRVGSVLGTVAGAGAYVGVASALRRSELGSVGPLVRTAVPPGAVALGRFASETLQALAVVVPLAATLLVIVGVGAGGPVAPVLLALAATPVLVLTVVLGRLLGDLLRYLNDRLGLSTWTKAALLVGVVVVAFLGTQAAMTDVLGAGDGAPSVSISAVLPGAPLQAYAGVAFAPLGAAVRPVGVAAAALVVAAVPVALAATVRFERWLLLREPTADRDEARGTGRSRETPRAFRLTPSTRVAWRYLLRTRRDPAMLAHLFPVFIGGMSFGASFVSDPDLALSLGPGAAVVAGAALAGGAYCLNPLGDDRDQLPLVLTSAPSTAVVLRGRALAGVVLGLLVSWGVAVPLELANGSVAGAVGHAALALVLLAAGAGTALGMGALLPRFERREYLNVERAHPSMLVVVGYFFGTMVVGIAGMLTLLGILGDPSALHWVAMAGFLVVVALSGVGGYALAVRTFDRLTLDDV